MNKVINGGSCNDYSDKMVVVAMIIVTVGGSCDDYSDSWLL